MRERRRDGAHGFSLIELMVVVGIILVGAAMAAPAIGRYFRNYRIREAQSQVAGAIQTARTRAITRNVNNGVTFVAESKTSYWVHIGDDLSTVRSRDPQPLDFAAPVAIQSTRYELPRGVEFVDGTQASRCTSIATVGVATFTPTSGWFGFTRLGGWCNGLPGCAATPVKAGLTPPTVIMNDTVGGSTVCLLEVATGLNRSVQVSVGGRLRATK